MIASPAALHYPHQMGGIVLFAMEEILGQVALNSVLDRASLGAYAFPRSTISSECQFPADHLPDLLTALVGEYGPNAGHGVAVRAGRACFKYGLRSFGEQLHLTDMAFRLLPLPARLERTSQALAGLFSQLTGQQIRLESDQRSMCWIIERCPASCCQLVVGLLQEACHWASGGRTFLVEETECMLSGAEACKIVIDRIPIG